MSLDYEIVDIDKMILLSFLSNDEQKTYNAIKELITLNKDLLRGQSNNIETTVDNLVKCIKTEEDRRTIYENCTIPEYRMMLIVKDLSNIIRDIDDALEMANSVVDEEEKQQWVNIAKIAIENLTHNIDIYRSLTPQTKEDIPPKHLLFLKTNAGNYYFEKDIKDIPEDYYNDFISMLIKLHNGEITGNDEKDKPIGRNNKLLKGLWEKKDYKVRIQYVKLPKDVYFIIMVQMKEDTLSDLEERYNKVETKKQIKDIKDLIQLGGSKYEEMISNGEKEYESFTGILQDQARKRNKN